LRGTLTTHCGAVEKVQIHHKGWHGQTCLAVVARASSPCSTTKTPKSVVRPRTYQETERLPNFCQTGEKCALNVRIMELRLRRTCFAGDLAKKRVLSESAPLVNHRSHNKLRDFSTGLLSIVCTYQGGRFRSSHFYISPSPLKIASSGFLIAERIFSATLSISFSPQNGSFKS